jgi:DNA repair photolyase
MQRNVISASRRTDIPAFYSDWFMNRLHAGYVYVQNPYSKKWSHVSLKAEDIGAIVFWSKHFSPLLNKLECIEKTAKNLFFHFTITANRGLEQNTPDAQEAIRDFQFLSRRYSPQHIVWRFDPICITDKLPYEIYEERFIQCAELLKGSATMCFISFAFPYRKVLRNLTDLNHTLADISIDEKREYALKLAHRAQKYGIELYACCNDYLLSEIIKKGSCINGQHLSHLFNSAIENTATPTRKECACTKSIDIGAYDTCAHACAYCYANTNIKKAQGVPLFQNPGWNALVTHVETDKAGFVVKY